MYIDDITVKESSEFRHVVKLLILSVNAGDFLSRLIDRDRWDCLSIEEIKGVNQEIFEWLEDNLDINDYYWSKDQRYYFRNEEDAMAFKLTFTG